MRVGLFGDRLARGKRITGVGGYITGLVRALGALESQHEFVLFSTREERPVPPGTYGSVPTGVIGLPRRPVQAAWAILGRPRINDLGGAFDLLHILVPSVPVPTDRPLVVTIHDLMPLKFPSFFTRKNRVLFGLAVEQARQQASRIITISEATRRDVVDLLEVPESTVDVVHYGPPATFRPLSSHAAKSVLERHGLMETTYILFVGEVTQRKNPLALVEAFGTVSRIFRQCRLVMVGPMGLGSERVLQRVSQLGLDERVTFRGHVAHDDLPALMAGASVFVLPSAYEGFGLPVLEAMMCGTAVVVSDAGSLPEVVGDAGYVVADAAPDRLAEAIVELLSDESLRADFVRRGHSRVQQFSWERAARETVAVYEKLAACELQS